MFSSLLQLCVPCGDFLRTKYNNEKPEEENQLIVNKNRLRKEKGNRQDIYYCLIPQLFNKCLYVHASRLRTKIPKLLLSNPRFFSRANYLYTVFCSSTSTTILGVVCTIAGHRLTALLDTFIFFEQIIFYYFPCIKSSLVWTTISEKSFTLEQFRKFFPGM